MSQLDKKSTAKKTFLMLIIFTVVCVGVTVALIYNTISLRKEGCENNKIENVVSENKQVEILPAKSTVEKLKLTDKYFTNGIKQEIISIKDGKDINDFGGKKLEISYIQISGLKDKTIQDKINKEIEAKTLSLRNDEELKDENIERIMISAYMTGNFSDVFSVSIMKTVMKKTDIEYQYEYEEEIIGLNYSLKNGEKIKFNDLFTEDAAIKNIITQAIYEELAWEYAFASENLDADMSTLDYGEIEDKIFKVLASYKQNPDLVFYFSPSTISFVYENKFYNIKMANFYESIAIYSRYKSKTNLYEDETIVSNVNYVFSIADMSEHIIDAGNKTDNLNYRILKNYSEKYMSDNMKKAEETIQKVVYEKIDEYAIMAGMNKGKGYIVDFVLYISELEGKVDYQYMGYLCSMDRQYYDENLEEILASSVRQEMVELSAIDYSWLDKENIAFEEEVSCYVQDYTNPIEEEQVITREDREKMEENIYY